MRLCYWLILEAFINLSLYFPLFFILIFRFGFLFSSLFISFFGSFQIDELSTCRFKLYMLHAISLISIFMWFMALRTLIIVFLSKDHFLDTRRTVIFAIIITIFTDWLIYYRRRTFTGSRWARRRLFAAFTLLLTTLIFIWTNMILNNLRLRDHHYLFLDGSFHMARICFIFFGFFLDCISFFNGTL